MTRPQDQHWPLWKAFAFLATVFALTLGIALPSAAAITAGSETPIRLCSGRMSDLVIVDGQVRKKVDGEVAITDCAYVMAGQVALPGPPVTAPTAPPTPVASFRLNVRAGEPAPPVRAPPRPPSTAPPKA